MTLLFPLTHPQKRIWYIEKTNPGTSVSNISATARIKERVDFAALEKSLNHVVRVNNAYRARIIERSGFPQQYFVPYRPFKVDFFDFSGRPVEDMYKWDTNLSQIPMKLIDSDLYYFAMFKLSETEGGL